MPTAFRRAVLLATMIVTAAAVACSASSDSGLESPQNATEPTSATAPIEAPADSDLNVALDFTLPSANGSPVTLSELSTEQPVVLVFYRAFW